MNAKPKHLSDIQVFLDSADPDETRRLLNQMGFLDGQTTNPTLLSRNPIVQNTTAGFSTEDLWDLYGTMLEEISYTIPNGSVSGEVYADQTTTAAEMLEQAKEINSWIDNAYIKFPTSNAGLEAAHEWIATGGKVNMTLGFTQSQAAAVHAATLGAKKGQVYFSLFIGRLYDSGVDGLAQLRHIKQLYSHWDSHVLILACSLRSVSQIQASIQSGANIITAPYKVLRLWMEEDFDIPGNSHSNDLPKDGILPEFLNLDKGDFDWRKKNYDNSLLVQGMKRFSDDWNNLIAKKK